MNEFIRRWKKPVYVLAVVWSLSAFAGSYDDFFSAVGKNDGATIVALLNRGFDVNSRDPKGQTALFLALRDNAFDAAEALLRSPSLDVNALNEVGESALMMAALRGQSDWVRRLMERGARVDKPDWTPLHYAATGPQPVVVRLLLDRGAAIDARSPNGSTPLMMAAQYGNEANVDVLLERGANPKLRNQLGLVAADFARLAGRDKLAARLDALARS